MITGQVQEHIMRIMQGIVVVAAALLAASATAQDLHGSFSTGPFGETFKVLGHGDGTADVFDSDGRMIGVAEDNGFGHWDIHTSGGRRLGEIQTRSDGSFVANDSDGRPWGTGRRDR
jgi:hypothetical protein